MGNALKYGVAALLLVSACYVWIVRVRPTLKPGLQARQASVRAPDSLLEQEWQQRVEKAAGRPIDNSDDFCKWLTDSIEHQVDPDLVGSAGVINLRLAISASAAPLAVALAGDSTRLSKEARKAGIASQMEVSKWTEFSREYMTSMNWAKITSSPVVAYRRLTRDAPETTAPHVVSQIAAAPDFDGEHLTFAEIRFPIVAVNGSETSVTLFMVM